MTFYVGCRAMSGSVGLCQQLSDQGSINKLSLQASGSPALEISALASQKVPRGDFGFTPNSGLRRISLPGQISEIHAR
eukprot:2714370-Prymnesium_polylepis.1